MAMGLPYQGDIWFWEENVYGGGETSGGTMLISDKVYNVRLDSGDIHKTLRGISEPTICGFISQPSDPVLHIEWVLQPTTPSATIGSLATYCCDRSSTGTVKSLAFEYSANKLGGTKSYYMLTGCVAKSFTLSASKGNEYICSADFSVQSVATASTTVRTKPTALGKEYARFNHTANTITITGIAEPAYITNSIEINVDNHITDYWDCDTSTKTCAIPGAKDIIGSCDISLNNGGAVHWGDVFGGAVLSSIAVVTGQSGIDDTFTLNVGRFDNTSVDQSLTDEGMMVSQPFTFKNLTIT